jgi:hypothetical protein
MRGRPVRDGNGCQERDRAGSEYQPDGGTPSNSGPLELDPVLHLRMLLSLDIDRVK